MTPEENREMLKNLDKAQENYKAWDKLGKYKEFPDYSTNFHFLLATKISISITHAF